MTTEAHDDRPSEPPLGLGLSEGLDARWMDALCPGCGEPASGLGSVGWLFVCHPCGYTRWGHPQVSYGEGGAAGLLHDARIEYRKAMHEADVRDIGV